MALSAKKQKQEEEEPQGMRLLDLDDHLLELVLSRLALWRRRAQLVCQRFRSLAASSCQYQQREGQTIQDCLDTCEEGDTVHLRPGHYKESILIRKPLHLTCDEGEVRIASPARFVVMANAPCLLERLTLKSHSSLDGMDMVSFGPGSNYIQLRRCQLYTGNYMGIPRSKGNAARLVLEHCRLAVGLVVEAGTCTISDCTYEIVPDPVTVLGQASLSMRRCTFLDAEACLNCDPTASVVVRDCTFWGFDRGPVFINAYDEAEAQGLLVRQEPALTPETSYICSFYDLDTRLLGSAPDAEQAAAIERGQVLSGKQVFWGNKVFESNSNANLTAQQEEVRREARQLMTRVLQEAPPMQGGESDSEGEPSLGNSQEEEDAGDEGWSSSGSSGLSSEESSGFDSEAEAGDEFGDSGAEFEEGEGPAEEPFDSDDDLPLFWEDEQGHIHVLDTDSSSSEDSGSSSSGDEGGGGGDPAAVDAAEAGGGAAGSGSGGGNEDAQPQAGSPSPKSQG